MKRVMIVVIVMVMLLGISEKALADVWSRCGLQSSYRFQHGGRRFLGGSFRTPLRSFRTPYGNVWNRSGLSSSGGFVRYGRDRTLGRALGYSGLAMNVLHGLNQISVDNQALGMAKEEQKFRHQQIIRDQQIRAQNNTVLVRRGPIVLQMKRPKKTRTIQTQENEKVRQEMEALKIQLKKLQQKLEKQAKK